MSKFTPNDLRTGDFVLRRNGYVEMFIDKFGGVFVSPEGFNMLSSLDDNFKIESHSHGWDVVSVRRPEGGYDCTYSIFARSGGDVVYEEEKEEDDVIEITLSDLRALFGKNIKIIE